MADDSARHPVAVKATPDTNAAGQTRPQYDAIAIRAIGIVGQPDIDWQNRPTFHQAVESPRNR
jgi:hypothetical protein